MGGKLESEQEALIVDNRRLVYYLVKKLGVPPSDFEDIVSIGTIGLIKAATTFDTSKGVKFASYASRCINNEIYMHFRKVKKEVYVSSLEEIINQNSDGDQLTLADTLFDTSSDFERDIDDRETITKMVSIILNCLSTREKVLLLCRMSDRTQRQMADSLGISQSYVSRLQKKLIKTIRSYSNLYQNYKEVFTVELVNDQFKISFSSADVPKFNQIFANFLTGIDDVKGLTTFEVSCSKERVVIYLPADIDSFSFIAKIVQEIDNFHVNFIAVSSEIPKTQAKVASIPKWNEGIQNQVGLSEQITDTTLEEAGRNGTQVEILNNDAPEPEGIPFQVPQTSNVILTKKWEGQIPNPVEVTDSTLEKTKSNDTQVEDNQDITVDTSPVSEGKIGSRPVQDYLLTLTSFTMKDLRRKFPNASTSTLNNAVYLARSKGHITKVGRSEYLVISSSSDHNIASQVEPKKLVEATNSDLYEKQNQQVMEYMLTLDIFELNELEIKFPDVSIAIITNVVRIAKVKGLIVSTNSDSYCVKK